MTVITAEQPSSIGSYVHIGAQVFIAGGHGFEIGDFVNLSSGATIFTVTDDFSGETMAGALLPESFRAVFGGAVRVGDHVVIGARCVVLPGVIVGEGVAVGALSLVKTSLEPWGIYAGIPAKLIRARSRVLLKLTDTFLEQQERGRESAPQ
jgi:galactoside O-acetyltransferase